MHVLTFFSLPIKVSIYLIRKSGGEPIQVVSTFGGCTQYTPQIGYVVDPDVIRHPV